MAGLEPGSFRYQTLEAAKRFKSSWIELGRMLWTVYKEKKYREWGYLTFEAYCAKEVAIRVATAKKLLHSYYFLEKEEPETLRQLTEESGPQASVPSPDSVNLLRLLRRRQGIPDGDYQQVRTYVLEKGEEAPEVRRQVRSILEARRPQPPEAEPDRRRAAVKRMIGTLRAIRTEMAAGSMLPRGLLRQIESLIAKLEQAV